MNIPERLKNCKFILTNGKIPIEKDWQNTNNYDYTNPKFVLHINRFKSCGVLCGYNNLLVIDFDQKEIMEEIINKNLLPETFTVKTAGKGLLHLYYYVDNPESFKCLNKEGDTILDVQGKGKQVICPNTIINNKKYEVFKDLPIANTTIDNIKEILKPYNYVNFIEIINNEIKKRPIEDDVINKIKDNFKPANILDIIGIDININPTKCPFHNSKAGKCLSFNNDVWHCFHCERGGDSISLYQEYYKKTFIETKKELAEKIGIFIKVNEKFNDKIENQFDIIQLCQDFFYKQPYIYDRNNIWWIFDKEKNTWVLTDETEIIIAIKNTFKIQGITGSNLQNNLLNGFKIIGREFKLIIPTPNLILFGNLIYDIKKKTLIENTYHYFFTNSINYIPSDYEDTPIIDKLFIEWVGEEYKQTLYEIIAYCCYADYPMHLIFNLVGSGRNGKSRFMALLRKFIGDDNVTSSELELLMENRFETAKLYKKLVCLLGETNFDVIRKTSMIKKISGDDYIGMEFKNKNPFDNKNYAKIIIASNSLPTCEDTSEGWYRRNLIINFPNEFTEGKDILNIIPEGEYNNLAKKVCRILPELIEKGSITNQGTIEERKKRYIEASNPLSKFLEEETERNIDYYVRYNDLYNEYVRYLTKHKKRVVNRKEFKDILILEGLESTRTTLTIQGNQENGIFFYTLKFKNNESLNIKKIKYEEVKITNEYL